MSHYQLVGPAGWTHAAPELMVPHPDYFTTLLWRQVHAPNVLMRAHVHVYTHVHMNVHESVAQLVGSGCPACAEHTAVSDPNTSMPVMQPSALAALGCSLPEARQRPGRIVLVVLSLLY